MINNRPSALYEADKKAHEEAVQNGGVRHKRLLSLVAFIKLLPFHSSSCTGTASRIRQPA